MFVPNFDADGSIHPAKDCTTAGTVITCASLLAGDGPLLLPYLYVEADAGATPGASGTVTVTLAVNGYPSVTATPTYTVAHDVDLAVTVPAQPVPAGVRGKPVGVPLEVHNLGDRTVDGVGMRIVGYQGLQRFGDYSNCGYDDGDQVMFCRFDEAVTAGGTYLLSDPALAVRTDAAAGTGRYSAILVTGDEFDNANYFDGLRRGTQGVLHLVPKPAAARLKAPTIDSNAANNLAFGSVTIPAAPASPTPSPSEPTPGGTASGTGGTGGADGTGGGLPITGAPVAALAGFGALLLVLGATGMRLARRRRFEA